MTFEVDDQLRLRKAHPCGGTDWVVYRLGADIGLRCGTCGHRVLVPRRELERRVVRMFRPVPPNGSAPPPPSGDVPPDPPTEAQATAT